MTGSERAERYVDGVLSGAIVVCAWVTRACERHRRDQGRIDGLWTWSPEKADHAVKFIELLPHVKGRWGRKRTALLLEDWQCFLVSSIFGWLAKDTGLRRFQEAYICVPRKNGKSALAAGIALYMTCADKEYAAETYCGATTERQAWEVFGVSRNMALKTPELCQHYGLEVRATQLVRIEDGSKCQPVVGAPGDGSSPSCAILDEFHEHTTPALYDTMNLGMGSREQPLMLLITTAGTSLSGPCYAKHGYAEAVLLQSQKDDRLFALMYGIDEADAWDTVEAAKKANPNFGISIQPERIERDLLAAKQSPYLQNAYKTKHLNVWCSARAAWMDMRAWAACPAPPPISAQRGRMCFLGVDLGAVEDLSALVALFPPEKGPDGGDWCAYAWFYVPEAAVHTTEAGADYAAWSTTGHLTLTKGAVADYDRIISQILLLCAQHKVAEVGYDPWQALYFATQVQKKIKCMVKVPQNVQQLSEPMKSLNRLVHSRRLAHGNNPVLNWMMANVTAKEDVRGNVYPHKHTRDAKIDGVLALLNAHSRALAAQSRSGNIDAWLNKD